VKFLKNFFKTKYRIYKKNDRFYVQEHEWWDFLYGHWWHVGFSSSTYEGALAELEDEKKSRSSKIVVVHEE
jgi:hypothetical protein